MTVRENPGPNWLPPGAPSWDQVDAALPDVLRAHWASAQTTDDLGQRVRDFLTGACPFQPGYWATAPDPETTYLIDFLADYCRSGFTTTESQPGMRETEGFDGRLWQQRAFVAGLMREPDATALSDTLACTDLIIMKSTLTQDSDFWPTLPVTLRAGVRHTHIGVRLSADDAVGFFADYTAIPRHELDALVWVQIFDPVWGRNDFLWPTVHLALTNDRARAAALASMMKDLEQSEPANNIYITGPLGQDQDVLTHQQRFVVNSSLPDGAIEHRTDLDRPVHASPGSPS